MSWVATSLTKKKETHYLFSDTQLISKSKTCFVFVFLHFSYDDPSFILLVFPLCWACFQIVKTIHQQTHSRRKFIFTLVSQL